MIVIVIVIVIVLELTYLHLILILFGWESTHVNEDVLERGLEAKDFLPWTQTTR